MSQREVAHRWSPIADLPADHRELVHSDLVGLCDVWREQKAALEADDAVKDVPVVRKAPVRRQRQTVAVRATNGMRSKIRRIQAIRRVFLWNSAAQPRLHASAPFLCHIHKLVLDPRQQRPFDRRPHDGHRHRIEIVRHSAGAEPLTPITRRGSSLPWPS